MGLAGWARPARLVRGVVLSAKERGYVLAARGFGASHFRHPAPPCAAADAGVALTQAALLGATVHSGGSDAIIPRPGGGGAGAELGQHAGRAGAVSCAGDYWWMALPAVAMVPVFLGYLCLAGALLEARKSVTL